MQVIQVRNQTGGFLFETNVVEGTPNRTDGNTVIIVDPRDDIRKSVTFNGDWFRWELGENGRQEQ